MAGLQRPPEVALGNGLRMAIDPLCSGRQDCLKLVLREERPVGVARSGVGAIAASGVSAPFQGHAADVREWPRALQVRVAPLGPGMHPPTGRLDEMVDLARPLSGGSLSARGLDEQHDRNATYQDAYRRPCNPIHKACLPLVASPV
jgi:hypothetical protein